MPGFSWIPKKEWLKPDAGDSKIGSNKMKEIVLGLDIPAKTDLLNQRWEGIIFVESEEGSADFARVQIKNPGR
jgi:hypothetical protein